MRRGMGDDRRDAAGAETAWVLSLWRRDVWHVAISGEVCRDSA